MSKRAAPSSLPDQKRTRFAPSHTTHSISPSGTPASLEDDDAYLNDDFESNAAATRQKARRSLRDTGGYASDSSGDEEGVVPSRRPGAKDDDEDDVDMFADDVDEGKGKDKGKPKEKEFMDLEDIEGQEFDKPSQAKDDSDSETEEVKTGLDGDMGIDITPFNMKNELAEGRFTAGGETYVANDEDPNDKYDVWLSDLDKEEIKKARRAHREQQRLEEEREAKEAGGGEEKEKKEQELLQAALGLMERGETVLEALQRLGKQVEDERKKREAGSKKKSWAERQKERKVLMAAQEEQTDSIHTSNPFTNLSNIVSGLTTIGHLDVYSLSRESIQRMLPVPADGAHNPPRAAPPPQPAADNRQFQYRFSMAYVRNLPEGQRPVEREVFGPFSLLQLRGWRSTGFFGPSCENVELRLVPDGGEPGQWGPWTEVVEQ
ncbi:CD2 antigen cytoplasmic tail-binding protein 2 [Cryptococcus gattii E566]|uniref:SMC2orf, putative n=2 Tax=Cryptococcus gattii TaxID=37769 RepID=E6RAS2_CRYGW|nr:SMC2orf, putative [Cryptococcus gattii WM276]ADV23917.1 SMC2orf, putative [Cryptococcus gattii WM276]KIR81429.1 CD2 antigen cytoplasmic tail-binding protein 2 [Cryptococcus gattii EJB2]KIY35057.1 CD2 antigen cytoplasmic tail-binding protein 2 [Cryptococcus gattii E566]KJE03813.1 CD2 antigen cytoplasmic tail-binding protein 2 [Cryptococcus gattii NT-10]